MELSEAAGLADVFVLRLMFRIYDLPRTFAGYLASRATATGNAEAYYETKRLLARFAARRSSFRRPLGGKSVEYTRYLTISALTLDTRSGACAALSGERCGIYDRRPLACRTVPFHYSRPQALAESDLAAFVRTPGYRCDTSGDAPVVLAAGRILDAEAERARAAAFDLAERDGRWRAAILHRMKAGPAEPALPGLRQIETDAALGATTTSMRIAWQIAADAGMIDPETCFGLIAAQAELIDRELAAAHAAPDARATLRQMRGEYRQSLIR